VSSKAFIDYTSGLNTPEPSAPGAVLYRYWTGPSAPLVTGSWFVVVASLVSDPTGCRAALRRAGRRDGGAEPDRADAGRRTRRPPRAGDSVARFATLYYGFRPNTYYAKVATGIPRSDDAPGRRTLNSISHDPITLGTSPCADVRVADAGAARKRLSPRLYGGVTVSVGGDFMSGRFFAMPFLVALMTIAPAIGAAGAPWVAGALLVYNLLMPIVPVKTTAGYDAAWLWRTQNGIKDERGHYHRATNILFFSPFRELPDFVWVREGLSFRNGARK
jgi:hypothetical protein